MPALCCTGIYGGGGGDRSHCASQGSAGSVLGRLELAAYLPPMPRTEDGHGEPRPLHDAGAGRVAGASDGDRQPGNCTIGVSLRRWLAGQTRPRGAGALPPALLGQGLSGRPQDGERLEAIARSWGSMEGGDVEKTERAPSMDPEAIWPLLLDIRAAGPTEEEGPDMSDKESVLEGIQKAIDMVSALCAGKQKWIRSIPPQPVQTTSSGKNRSKSDRSVG